jgi:hypothetical protein
MVAMTINEILNNSKKWLRCNDIPVVLSYVMNSCFSQLSLTCPSESIAISQIINGDNGDDHDPWESASIELNIPKGMHLVKFKTMDIHILCRSNFRDSNIVG